MDQENKLMNVLAKAQKNAAAKNAASILEQLNLPFWEENVRGIPNGFLRSALCSAQRFDKNNHRSMLENVNIVSVKGVDIKYHGVELDQADLDIWETAVHIMRGAPLNEPLLISLADFFRILGKSSGGAMQRDLLSRLVRLRGATITIQQDKYSYVGGLIDEGAIDEETNKLMIRMNPKIINLFQKDQFTHVNLGIKRGLMKQPIALFLYRFYASHAAPFPLKLETIYKLCRSNAKNMIDFKKNVIKSLSKISEVCELNGETFNYEFKGDLLHVTKSGSASQQRHLEKKKAALKQRKNGAITVRHSTPQQLKIQL